MLDQIIATNHIEEQQADTHWIEGEGPDMLAIERQAFVFTQEGLATEEEIARLAD